MIAKKLIFLQLNDKNNFNKNHISKKYNNIFYYKSLKKKKIKGQTFKIRRSEFSKF